MRSGYANEMSGEVAAAVRPVAQPVAGARASPEEVAHRVEFVGQEVKHERELVEKEG